MNNVAPKYINRCYLFLKTLSLNNSFHYKFRFRDECLYFSNVCIDFTIQTFYEVFSFKTS